MSRSRCRSRSAWSHRRTPMSSPFRLAAPCAAPTSSRTAVCCWRLSTRSRSTGRPRSRSRAKATPAARCRSHVPPRTPSRDQHRPAPRRAGLPVSVRYRKAHLSRFRPDRPEGVRRELRRRGRRKRADHLPFSQNVGYDADGKLVEPIKYSSLYDDDADAKVTARASLWGLPGNRTNQSP